MTPDGNPDDATLLAALDTGRAASWRELARFDEEFRRRPQADDDCVWREHYPEYGARIETVCRLLAEVGAVTPAYHWVRQKPPALGTDGKVGPGDAVRLATTIIRAERFGDGNIERAVKEGVLQAVIAALVAWYRDRPV